eukprot:gnl/MRDRNA2_/MRDRNA2_76769_c1_seq1.p1 gnl/MRDRNA2_/MRDRNA2_76769_c1~~gnl/MRDRNA2_/MRDRNA2_76769_c1_seq1.p1  ORF type:complete len:351 (+),score=20.10 gnl/MRDRNA2_/MRDRNA2_76769_c1_seq1:131-1183(+)
MVKEIDTPNRLLGVNCVDLNTIAPIAPNDGSTFERPTPGSCRPDYEEAREKLNTDTFMCTLYSPDVSFGTLNFLRKGAPGSLLPEGCSDEYKPKSEIFRTKSSVLIKDRNAEWSSGRRLEEKTYGSRSNESDTSTQMSATTPMSTKSNGTVLTRRLDYDYKNLQAARRTFYRDQDIAAPEFAVKVSQSVPGFKYKTYIDNCMCVERTGPFKTMCVGFWTVRNGTLTLLSAFPFTVAVILSLLKLDTKVSLGIGVCGLVVFIIVLSVILIPSTGRSCDDDGLGYATFCPYQTHSSGLLMSSWVFHVFQACICFGGVLYTLFLLHKGGKTTRELELLPSDDSEEDGDEVSLG